MIPMSMVAIYSVFCDACPFWVGEEKTRAGAYAVAQASGWFRFARRYNPLRGCYGIDLCSDECRSVYNSRVDEGDRV